MYNLYNDSQCLAMRVFIKVVSLGVFSYFSFLNRRFSKKVAFLIGIHSMQGHYEARSYKTKKKNIKMKQGMLFRKTLEIKGFY